MNPLKIKDSLNPTDKLKPAKTAEKSVKQIREKTKKLQKTLERRGLDSQRANDIARSVAENAKGPISNHDWMKMQSDRFGEQTKIALQETDLSADAVLDNPAKAEEFVGKVIEMEGIPNGNGGTDRIKGAVPGHYDEAGHGIDVVAADQSSKPVVIEVKKYHQASGAKMSDTDTKQLEPEVRNWKQAREQNARNMVAHQDGAYASETWKPEVQTQIKQAQRDFLNMQQHNGELQVHQMDDLWTQDRWLKTINTSEGRERLRSAGIDEKYLNAEKLKSSPNLPEWKDILENRTVAIVSESSGDTGKRLFAQAVQERRAKNIFMIEVK